MWNGDGAIGVEQRGCGVLNKKGTTGREAGLLALNGRAMVSNEVEFCWAGRVLPILNGGEGLVS